MPIKITSLDNNIEIARQRLMELTECYQFCKLVSVWPCVLIAQSRNNAIEVSQGNEGRWRIDEAIEEAMERLRDDVIAAKDLVRELDAKREEM